MCVWLITSFFGSKSGKRSFNCLRTESRISRSIATRSHEMKMAWSTLLPSLCDHVTAVAVTGLLHFAGDPRMHLTR